MKTSQKGIDLIKQFEGFEPRMYVCPAGKPTIGYGTVLVGADLARLGDKTITEAEAEDMLRQHVQEEVESKIAHFIKATPSQNQYDAIVSFVYNVGLGAFIRSTLLRKFNAGDVEGAADEFLRWVRAGGKVLKGLERRRAAERALFLEQ